MKDKGKDPFEGMAKNWHSQIVARREIARFTGGAVHPSYMANLDCVGLGPPGRFRIGRNIVYPLDSLVGWLKGRSSPVSSENNFN